MKRWLMLTACCVVLGGCGAERAVTPEQIELVAWYIEDVAHARPRSPQELRLPEATPTMERLATWLSGTTVRDEHQPPRQLASRRDRWPVLKALFLQGHAVVLDDGLVAGRPDTPAEDLRHALPVIDAENLDRRAIDALLISLTQADRRDAKDWLATTAAARIALDVEGGAKRWVGKY